MFAVVGGTLIPTVLDGLVALLGADGTPVCSGVSVGPELVLTAAHCAEADPRAAVAGADAAEPRFEVSIRALRLHPGYAPGDADADLALVQLDEPLPGRIWWASDELPDVLDPVSIAGFGATADGADDAGDKRGATLQVVERGEAALLAFSPEANACSGDSGGPVTRDLGDGVHLVGVVTAVEPSCVGGRTVVTSLAASRSWLEEEAPELSWGALPSPAPPALGGRGCSTGAGRGTAGWLGVLLVRWNRRSTAALGHPKRG
jgi:hypothetical protein